MTSRDLSASDRPVASISRSDTGETPKPSGGFALELGPEVANITCADCGKPFKSVNGYMKKYDWTYSVYFATLRTGHDDIAVGLTVSIEKWWDGLALTAAVVRLEAHAVPKSSSPTVGIVVAGADFPVTLTYTIHWQVPVPDGQISRGEIPYAVKNL